jgi:hypothetical protein
MNDEFAIVIKKNIVGSQAQAGNNWARVATKLNTKISILTNAEVTLTKSGNPRAQVITAVYFYCKTTLVLGSTFGEILNAPQSYPWSRSSLPQRWTRALENRNGGWSHTLI